jgi:Flp pilus assembly pilin Flp
MLGLKNFLKEEDGVGVVELILILVVLIALVLIFKKQLTSLVNSIFDTITTQAGSV